MKAYQKGGRWILDFVAEKIFWFGADEGKHIQRNQSWGH